MTETTLPITQEFRGRVIEAIAKIRARGDRISHRNVRGEMGGGSPNWIAEVIREYQERPEEPEIKRSPQIEAAEQLFPGLLEQLKEAIGQQYIDEINRLKEALRQQEQLCQDQADAIEVIHKENESLQSRNSELDIALKNNEHLRAITTEALVEIKTLHTKFNIVTERDGDAYQRIDQKLDMISTDLQDTAKRVDAHLKETIEHLHAVKDEMNATMLSVVEFNRGIQAEVASQQQNIVNQLASFNHMIALKINKSEIEQRRINAVILRKLSNFA